MESALRLIAAAVIAAGTIAQAGCGGSSAAPSNNGSSSTLRADVTDPAGDAVSDARIAVSPDLVETIAEVASGNIVFTIRLAPGTLDRQTTRIAIVLDTDQSGATGIAQSDGLGADYAIDLAAAGSQATITKADAAACAARLSCFNASGTAPMTVTGDTIQVTVPLAVLGNDDGRMNFRVSSYVLFTTLNPVAFDYLPDAALAPARVQ